MNTLVEAIAATWAQPTVYLTTCDREPIHLIEAIQPAGFLVVLSADWLVERVSANAANYLGVTLKGLLGAPFRELVTREATHTIRNQLSSLHGPDAVERAFGVQLQDAGPLFDLALHMVGQTLIIEAEHSELPSEFNAGAMLRSMLDRMDGRADLMRQAARLVQVLTGFDRVMVYRFHADDSGEVIAECVRAGVEPYLGLRYPASDIPRQARTLLVRNPVRMLYDVDAEPSPILPHLSAADEPLDLSMSTLRAHSTMHIEYLRNMGVRATMTLSLVRSGRLWGIISCHHMAPRHVGFERRTTAELFARMLVFLIADHERDEIAAYELRARHLHNQLTASVIETGPTKQNITQLADQMAEIVPCNGIGIYLDGELTLKGATPTVDEFSGLRRFLDRAARSKVYATEELGHVFAPARDFVDRTAGILVLPISRTPRDYIVFFRQEIARVVVWAGNPGKLLETGPNGTRLTPRKSFEAWREVVRGRSTPWTEAELRTADALRVTLLELMLHLAGITDKQRQAATQKQELLVAELNHRVRNILGLIRALVAQSRTTAADIDTFATVLGDRVHALARAHDQITAKNWGAGSLGIMIATEAGAYLGTGATRIQVSGPTVLLEPQAFSTMALVIHELMTNAVKYGALAGPEGQVSIKWETDSTGSLVLSWDEIDGPLVNQPTRRGFGSTIIERSIPHELGGEATLDYAPDGLRARFRVPSQYAVIDDDADINATAGLVAGTTSPARLSGPVLLVEDNMIIAVDAEDMLLALGATRVSVASNVKDALQRIDTERPSFAVLDINLGHETSWPIATRLRKSGVPYVFATGYGNGIEYPLEHRSTPSITKPYSFTTIAQAVSEAMPPAATTAKVPL